jgi:hypothetical protein
MSERCPEEKVEPEHTTSRAKRKSSTDTRAVADAEGEASKEELTASNLFTASIACGVCGLGLNGVTANTGAIA